VNIQVSDRVELEDRGEDLKLLEALERGAPSALLFPWDQRVCAGLLNNLGKYRRYNLSSLRDLLRVLRNKSHHFRELPPDLQAALSPYPDGFITYFTSRFPQLLLHVYRFVLANCRDEPVFHKYIGRDSGQVNDNGCQNRYLSVVLIMSATACHLLFSCSYLLTVRPDSSGNWF
jgi:serine/threonine-protein kinase/endoribonuclease IRE1